MDAKIAIWSAGKFGRLEGARARVIELLGEQQEIPTHWRTAIIAAIAARPPAHNWIILHAHCTAAKESEAVSLRLESSTENI